LVRYFYEVTEDNHQVGDYTKQKFVHELDLVSASFSEWFGLTGVD
jgi:hypothetical protein